MYWTELRKVLCKKGKRLKVTEGMLWVTWFLFSCV